MNKSQLRHLARDYASGRLDYDDYLRKRGALIDAIVAGDIAIDSSATSAADFAAESPAQQHRRATPVPWIVGAIAVIAVVWIFLSSQQTDAPDSSSSNEADPVADLRVTGARGLVQDFLATRDWSKESLARFRDLWNALTPNEQAEARAAPWFRRLAEALREEINAHKALAEFDGSGLSTTTGKRLAAFGEFLGIGAEIPQMQAPDRSAAQQPDSRAALERQPLTGSQWLEAQQGVNYTLQLSAVDHLDRLEHLTASHPDVALFLVTSAGRQPRFRLLHGSFASEQQARRAYEALPTELRRQAPGPFVRRLDHLREELRDTGNSTSTVTTTPVPAPSPVYTLQIFASSNRDNVDRLVARYGDLHLRVHVSEGDSTPFRVLYGEFDSPEAAQAASAALPITMLKEIGKPLLRDTIEFN
ncbi:MAG: SPOR domain-containing protein [Gammaproteobacteria bacterium]|nr:SPOR domain-containing protein [Gammaproteobacteria bacterium]MDX2458709.1 SPOR domain-containing protein [Gammaproteobacteria bacterium]